MIQIRNVKQQEYSSSQQEIKFNNTMLIFNLIRDHMPISRIELTKRSPLSASTVSKLVEDLLEKQWILETESVQNSSRGRRSIQLEVNGKRGYVATVELLGQGYICTLYDICLQKIAGTRIRNTAYDADTIGSTIRELLRGAKIASSALIGIHLIFPGVVDSISGNLISSPVFPDEAQIERHLVIQLKKQFFDAHVMISTNGAVNAFDASLIKKGPSRLPLLAVNIDEAIFAGVVLTSSDGRMNFCFPVEVGHSVLDYNGPKCRCGNRGCAEILLSTPALFRALNEQAGMKLEYSEVFGAECNVTAMKQVAKALEAGRQELEPVMREYIRVLCSVLRSVVDLLNIRSVRVGGDIAMLGETFLRMLRECFYTEFHPINSEERVQIELFNSDYENVRLAATIMCLDAIFRKQ